MPSALYDLTRILVGCWTISTVGGMAVAVPAELAGLEYAWRTYGSGNVSSKLSMRNSSCILVFNNFPLKVSWADIVTPSVSLAQGFVVGDLLAKRIEVEHLFRTIIPPTGGSPCSLSQTFITF